MPNTPRTPQRAIRLDDSLWYALGAAVDEVGTDRSTYLRDFVRWALRERGAPAPARFEADVAGRAREVGAREAAARAPEREEARKHRVRPVRGVQASDD